MQWLLVAAVALVLLIAWTQRSKKQVIVSSDWQLLESRFSNNHILVQVAFPSGVEPQWWILDTGSTHNLVDANYASRFQRQITGTISDVNQPGKSFSAQSLESGWLVGQGQGPSPTLDLSNAGVLDLSHLGTTLGYPLAGIIGYPFWSKWTVSLDIPRKQVWIKAPGSFSLPPTPSHAIPNVIDSKMGDHHLLLLPVSINGGSVGPWSLDTGSNISIATFEFATRRSLKGSNPTKAQLVNRTINIAPLQINATIGQSPTISGTIYIPTESFAEATQGLDGNLGLDLLQNSRVTIDYSSQRVVLD